MEEIRTPLLTPPPEELKEALFDNARSKPPFDRLSELLYVCDDGSVDFCRRGGVDFVYGWMQQHMQDREVVCRCCIAVALLLSRMPMNQQEAKEIILSLERVDLIVKAMETYPADAVIQAKCMGCILHMPEKHDEFQEPGAAAVKAVIKGMKLHPNDLEVQSMAVQSLRRLCNKKENQVLIVARGGFCAVELARKRFPCQPLLQVAACCTLASLGLTLHEQSFKNAFVTSMIGAFVWVFVFYGIVTVILDAYVELSEWWDGWWYVDGLFACSLGLLFVLPLILPFFTTTAHYELATPHNYRPYVTIVPVGGFRFARKYNDFSDAYLDTRRVWCNCFTLKWKRKKPSDDHVGTRKESRVAPSDAKNANCVVLVRRGKWDVVLYPIYPGRFVEELWRGIDEWRKNGTVLCEKADEENGEGTSGSPQVDDSNPFGVVRGSGTSRNGAPGES